MGADSYPEGDSTDPQASEEKRARLNELDAEIARLEANPEETSPYHIDNLKERRQALSEEIEGE